VLALALLIPKAETARLLEAAAHWAPQADAHGLQLELSGPWPAYSFTAAAAETAA
jgi:hypothetical protein